VNDRSVSDERLREALANPPGPRHAVLAVPLYRCKKKKSDGGIVDGCGWQGRNTDLCPNCGSDVLRMVDAARYESEARAVDSTGNVTRFGAQHLPGLAGDAEARKSAPMARGLLDYFPNALAYVSYVSKAGNDQHNQGEPMHWAFEKSSDEADCILRHLAERGTVDASGPTPLLHSGKVAWRALALLERELLERNPEMQPGKSVRNFKRGA
jgi:hypothetical protein